MADEEREGPTGSRPGWSPRGARADLLAIFAVLNWGLSYGLTKLAFREWQPLVFTGTRFLIMAAIALLVLAAQGRLGALLGPDRARFAFASTLLLTTVPLFSLVFLWVGGIESVRRSQWAGIGLATAGILLFIGGAPDGLRVTEARLGDLLSLGAAASFALYGIVNKPLAARYPASTVLAGTLLIGGLPLVPLGLVGASSPMREGISALGWAIWGYAVILPIYLAYTWWTAAIALRGVGAIAPYILLVPMVGGLFALVWLGEAVGLASAAGATITLVGLALSRNWLPGRRRTSSGA
jgi:drug/metabolite transporter (DMT)-like permease